MAQKMKNKTSSGPPRKIKSCYGALNQCLRRFRKTKEEVKSCED